MDFLINAAENIPTIIVVLTFSCWVMWRFREHLAIVTIRQAVLSGILTTAALFLCCILFAKLDQLFFDSNWFVIFQGAIFFGPPLFWGIARLLKLNTKEFFDIVAILETVTIATARLGCLFSGCCRGLPLFQTGLHWPVREAELILAIVIFVYFWKRLRDHSGNGELYPLFMIIHGIGRFFIEGFVDIPYRLLGVHPVHIWSIISILIGCSIYFEMRSQKAAKEKHRRT